DLGGMPPPEGCRIFASYSHVATGAAGNVGPGAIKIQRKPDPTIALVGNLVRASGGTDEEDIEGTKRRAPRELRNFNRPVTLEDYEDLALKCDNRVKKVRALGPRYMNNDPSQLPESYAGLIRQEGSVIVIILEDYSEGDPTVDPQPNPSLQLLQEVYRY